MRCLAECGAHINQARHDGFTPLFMAAQEGCLDVVRFLVKELGADVNQERLNGSTPLMPASFNKHADVVTWLIKAGANPQTSVPGFGTAAAFSKVAGASMEQTAYLEAKTHCSCPSCSEPGLTKCTGCLQARLWSGVSAGSLGCTQVRLQATEGSAQGWQRRRCK
jgi:hypothetical protein